MDNKENCFSFYPERSVGGEHEANVPKDDKYEVYLESWLSGRKRLTANEVRALNPFEGSNPSLSALAILIFLQVFGISKLAASR